MSAEAAYVFRHALLRDAAYQLQLPRDRARLHALAFAVIETLAGGRPAAGRLDGSGGRPFRPHASDPFARELAEHAAASLPGGAPADPKGPHALYLRRAAEVAGRSYQNPVAEGFWRRHADLVRGMERAESLRRTGLAALQTGRFRAAEPHFEQAMKIARQHRCTRAEGLGLRHIAALRLQTGRLRDAARGFELALRLFRRIGDRHAEAVVMGNIGDVWRERGNLAAARRWLRRSLEMSRKHRNRTTEALVISNLAGLSFEEGRFEEARLGMLRALRSHRRLGERRMEGQALGNLATVLSDKGRLEEAAKLYEEALAIHGETGNLRSEGVALGNFAGLLWETGRLDAAEEAYRKALSIHGEVEPRIRGLARLPVRPPDGRKGTTRRGARPVARGHRPASQVRRRARGREEGGGNAGGVPDVGHPAVRPRGSLTTSRPCRAAGRP